MKRSNLLRLLGAAAAAPVVAPLAAIAPAQAATGMMQGAVSAPLWIRFANGALIRSDLATPERLADCMVKWGTRLSIHTEAGIGIAAPMSVAADIPYYFQAQSVEDVMETVGRYRGAVERLLKHAWDGPPSGPVQIVRLDAASDETTVDVLPNKVLSATMTVLPGKRTYLEELSQ